MLQKHKKSRNHPQEPDTKGWPELEPVRPSATPEQALAKEVVRMRAENANKLLILRSRALLAVVVLALLSVVQNAFHVVPALLRGGADITLFLFASSMILFLPQLIF